MKRSVIAIVVALALACFASAVAEVEVVATGDVHYRMEPSLDGEKLGTLKNGKTLPFGYEVSTDDRGVDWYLAGNGDDWVWVSSRYSQLSDGTTDELTYDAALKGKAYLVLSDDTLAVSPDKGIGETDIAKDSAVTGTGFCKQIDGEHTWMQVEYEGETGWLDTLNISAEEKE